MNNIKETINIAGRVLIVSPKTALEIRQKIVARLKRDARISEELRREKLLPSSFRNQTGSLTRSNYSKNDTIDKRVLNHVIRGMTSVIETRFENTLRREWTA